MIKLTEYRFQVAFFLVLVSLEVPAVDAASAVAAASR